MIYRKANDTSLLQYRPSTDETVDRDSFIENSVAWLTIDNTNIDYPVMQGIDNTEYINTDPYGKYSMSGSIFLDCRNSPDFSDEYSLIYGHHMEYGFMFGALDKYLDKDYLKQHQTGALITPDQTYDIRLFATLEAPAEESAIFDPVDAPFRYIHAHAKIELEYEKGKLLALSTCKYPETSDRIIVFGILTPTTTERENNQ